MPVMQMSKEELIEHAVDIFGTDEITQIKLTALYITRAEELGIGATMEKMLSAYRKEDEKLLDEHLRDQAAQRSEIQLTRDKRGNPLVTIENFLHIMRVDKQYSGIRYNLLANRPEVHKNGEVLRWSDADASASKLYIEAKYHIHSESKHQDALRLLFREREYHPIQEIVDKLVWDGTPRVEQLLCKWLKAEDTPYVREVSRLIFAGGIHRLYNPGCKFDDVPVLIGTRQGEGKSSFIRWLAIHDSYYTEVTEFDGPRATEQLDGAWICEIAELLALTRAKEQEAVKSYITRQRDKYRKPYDRESEELPRKCVFVGTTNNEQFLKDKTGNRRFYPVKTNSSGYWLFDHEEECRSDILQCWAEAREKYLRGEMPNFADRSLSEHYREAQSNAMEDDWRIGAIQAYLDEKISGERVCIRQLAHEALSPDPDRPRDPSKAEANEIAQIMTRMEGWEKGKTTYKFPRYGKQRYWMKTAERSSDHEELPFSV